MEEEQKSKIEKKIRSYRRAIKLSFIPMTIGLVGTLTSIFAESHHVPIPQDFPIQRYDSLWNSGRIFRDAGSWEEDVRAYLSNNYRELNVPRGFPALQAYEAEIKDCRGSIKEVSARAIEHCDKEIGEIREDYRFRDYFCELDRWEESKSGLPMWNLLTVGSVFPIVLSLMKKDELERKLKEENGKKN